MFDSNLIKIAPKMKNLTFSKDGEGEGEMGPPFLNCNLNYCL